MRLSYGSSLQRPHLLVACGCLFVGCNQGRPTAYTVEGTVTLRNGTLLPGGIIELQPVDTELKKFGAHGEVGPDGKFRLTTFREGDGAVAGEHRRVIQPAVEPVKSVIG